MALKTLLPLERIWEISDATWVSYLRRRNRDEVRRVAKECGVRHKAKAVKAVVIEAILAHKRQEAKQDWDTKLATGRYEVAYPTF